MLARAVNGNAAFLPTLGGGFDARDVAPLVGILVAALACIRDFREGRSELIVRDGRLDDGVASRKSPERTRYPRGLASERERGRLYPTWRSRYSSGTVPLASFHWKSDRYR
jgi:hypothetical protein